MFSILNVKMQQICTQIFQDMGVAQKDAALVSATLKHGNEPPRPYISERHRVSAENHAWLDRMSRHVAILQAQREAGRPPNLFALEEELADMTGHEALKSALSTSDKRIADLMSTAKKERSSGFLVCRQCKSTKVDVDQLQTRSADEPMTLFALCTDCGTRWTMK